MTLPIHLTPSQARRFLLAHQCLSPAYPLQGKAGIRDYIRRVGCIQFDPLNITGQNADLVLQARVADYRPDLLQSLLYEDRLLLDGADKVQSIYAVEDWPCFERWRAAARQTRVRSNDLINAAMPQVLEAIEQRGPLCSHDLEMNETVHWYWGVPARLSRAVLDILYFRGDVVVHHKQHTRKYYDLARRCIPPELLAAPDPHPTEEAYQEWHVLRRVGSVGLLWDRSGEVWIGMLAIKSPQRKAALARLLDQGRLGQATIEGFKEPFYYRTQDEPVLRASLAADAATTAPSAGALDPVRLMAPLDNLLWDRHLIHRLFDFEYTWEVYTPAAKRRYGYYVLPVLAGERFIARCEPALDRKRRLLVLKNWWWEPGIDPADWLKPGWQALDRLARVFGAAGLEGEIPAHA